MNRNIMDKAADGFRLREYGRTELAQLYAPDITPEAAWRKLRSWMDIHPTLGSTLAAMGYDPRRQRSFTPAQVRVITEAIGEP